MKRTFLLVTLSFVIGLTCTVLATFDPFAPKNQVTLWLKNTTDPELVSSFLRQAGFLAAFGDIKGKALLTNCDTLTQKELEAIEDFVVKGGKVIFLGTKNLPQLTFLGLQTFSKPTYLEILSPLANTPKMLEFPNCTVSLFVLTDQVQPLASYYNSDGVTSSHIEPINWSVVKTSWGLYFGFDWLQKIFLEEPTYQKLLLLWLRQAIWN